LQFGAHAYTSVTDNTLS